MQPTSTVDYDVVVAGGGVAGSSTACALAARGFRVLLCEAGLPTDKRLAGELIHPPGAANLDALGLLGPVRRAGGVPVYGFCIFRGPDDPGTLLSYSEVPGGRPTGIAAEHALLTRTILAEAAQRPGVTLWEGARVLDADLAPRCDAASWSPPRGAARACASRPASPSRTTARFG